MCKSCFLAVLILFFPLYLLHCDEVAKKVTLTAKEITFSEKRLKQIGAITFFAPQDAKNPYPQLKGFARHPKLSRVDGRNHTLEGKLVGTGDKPAVATNLKRNQILINRVSLINGKKFNVDRFDISWLVDKLKEQADLVITKDTIYRGGKIGSPNDYKIVVVKGARLRLTQDFEGYGILILSDERINNPIWDDEDLIDAIDFKNRKLKAIFDEIANCFKFKKYRLPRVRRRVRLIMEDTASWHGVIISDLGEESEDGIDDDRFILKPFYHVIENIKGKWKVKHLEEIHQRQLKLLEIFKEKKPQKKLPQIERFKKLLKKLETKLAYAMAKKVKKERKEKILPIRRLEERVPKKIGSRKVIIVRKKFKYLPGGPVIILGRQSRRWHPPYPWPIFKIEKKIYTPYEKRKLKLLKWIELTKRRRTIPQPGDGVSVYGAIILTGSRPMVLMGLADVFYSQEAIDMVNNCIRSKRAFSWEQWKEAE